MPEDLGAVLESEAIEPIEGTEPVESGTEPAPEPIEGIAAPELDVEGDGRTLPQWIRNLKASDPVGYKEAKGIFFGKKSLDEKLKDFDLDGTRTWLEEVGGRESIAEKLTSLEASSSELQQINEAIQSGNTDLVREIAEVAPETFPSMAQAASEQWRSVDPEGWQHYQSGIIAATIAQSGVPMFLERMAMMLEFGKTEELGQSLAQLKQWATSFATAKAPERQPGRQDTRLSEREQALNQRESAAFNDGLNRDVDSFRSTTIESELKDYIAKAPQDADKKEIAFDRIRSQVIARMSADQKFQRDLNALTANRDKEGALRLIRSRETTAIKEIAPKVGKSIYGEAKAAVAKPPVRDLKSGQSPLRRPAEKPPTDPAESILKRAFSR